jgi:flagellar hook-associated protein 1
MAGLSSTLEIAKSTLLNEQVLIQTASHNISNAENKAYARQKANLVTNPAYRTQAGWLGMGARIDQITQVRDRYVEQQLLTGVAQQADYSTRSGFLESIGTYLNDDGSTGISNDLGRFWDAWDALSQNSGGIVERQGVISAAETVVGTLQSSHANLTALKQNIQSQTGYTVTRINDLLSKISSFNKSISSFENSGKPANDLRDLRYQALTDLSELIGFSSTEEADGSVTISLQDGSTPVTIVSNQNTGKLLYDQGTGLVSYQDPAGDTVAPDSNNLSGGSLAGLLASSQKTTNYINRINTLVSDLILQVNTIYDPTLVKKVFDGVGAADIAVNSIFKDPANINADGAADIADLQNTQLLNLGDCRFIDFLADIQQQIGLDQQDALSRADFQGALVEHLQAQQQSSSGVSIDEEMIELLKHQQVYQAAARIVNTTQQLLNAVIGMVGSLA